ncbi:uncharacterized protein NEMAJ01_1773 [Nematocida major]|uniref:uncharacterized protein n=1 Tax=Nematocida major TaxID=1912982 RepID=UPI0020074FD5|nr:uncharacterized protein NEMAJ01_1773 [Nematocida major]KAH9386877.1 hypothetical protein NEMAJ01_1773 [Nematocida major]
MHRDGIRDYSNRLLAWYNLTLYKGISLGVVVICFLVTLFLVNVAANVSSFWSPIKAYNYSLQDIGCDFFNTGYQGSFGFNDAVDIVMICFIAITALCIVINRLAVFIALKLLAALTISYLLRCFTLMSTALPDSWNVGLRTIDDTFASLSRDRGGDLIFSGHTLLLCSFAHCWSSFYLLSDSFAMHVISGMIAWVAVLTVLVFIIVGRLHYTIDVLLGIYISSGVWWSLDYFLSRYFEIPVCKLKFRQERIPPMLSNSADPDMAAEQPVLHE